MNGFSEEIMKKALIEANRKPAFGQSAQRKFNLTKKEEFNAPGPAQYQIREKTYKPRKENATANFASNTKHHEIAFEVRIYAFIQGFFLGTIINIVFNHFI